MNSQLAGGERPHEPTTECRGLHCYTHNIDEPDGGYIACGECFHVYRTQRALRRSYRRMARMLSRLPAGGRCAPRPPTTLPSARSALMTSDPSPPSRLNAETPFAVDEVTARIRARPGLVARIEDLAAAAGVPADDVVRMLAGLVVRVGRVEWRRLSAAAIVVAELVTYEGTMKAALTWPRSYYFAATYASTSRLRVLRDRLLQTVPGAVVTSRWLDNTQPVSLGPDVLNGSPDRGRVHAQADLQDIDAADTLIALAGPWDSTSRGGRHVEFGYALARGKRLVLVGARDNVFYTHPAVEQYPTWVAFLDAEVKARQGLPA